MNSLGKSLRLANMFDHASQTSVVIPMDHAIEGAEFPELDDPRELITSFVDVGVDGFLLRRGLAQFALKEFAGRGAFVQRVTARTGLATGADGESMIAGVEQAMRNGADAVCNTFMIGGDNERYQVAEFGKLADECAAVGMPLVGEVFPLPGEGQAAYDGPFTVDEMRMAVRTACEEGADVIKTWYSGDPESYRQVISCSTVPVLIAGGPPAKTQREVLEIVHGAMAAGAKGLMMGRKIWQSPNPPATASALMAIVRNGASVNEAEEILHDAVAVAR